MSINKQANGYALELLVGIQDEFSGKSKAIEAETKRLDKEVKQLQKTTGDITKFKKSEEALQDLESQQLKNKKAITEQRNELKRLKKESGDTKEIERQERALQELERQNRDTTASSRQYERQLRRLRRSLTETGVDINNLSNDESKLQTKINQTNKAIREQSKNLNDLGNSRSNIQSFSDGVAMMSGAGAISYLMYRGNDMERHAREYSARTGVNYDDVMSPEQVKFRAKLIADGATSSEIFTAQTMANHQGMTPDETMSLVSETIALKQTFPNFDIQEISRAIATSAKSFDVSVEKASNNILSVVRRTGDANGDVLDTYAEYSPLIGGSVTIEQYSAGLTAAREAGVWNYDKVGDFLKESFRSRFSDPNNFSKIVGNEDNPGSIDLITNARVRDDVRTKALALRYATNNNGDTGLAYAELMQSIMPLYESDKNAVTPLLESIGGTILSEDIGINGIKAFTEAINSPDDFIDETNSREIAKSTRTTIDGFTDSLQSVQSVLDSSISDFLYSQSDISEKAKEISKNLSSEMADNKSLSHAGVAAELAALGFGGTGVIAWLLKRLGKNKLTSLYGSSINETGTGGGKVGLANFGTIGYALSLIPDFSPVALNRANDRDDRGSFFGFETSDTGYLGINQNFMNGYKKVGILDVWDEWFGGNTTDKPDEVQKVESMVKLISNKANHQQSSPSTSIELNQTVNVELSNSTPEQAQQLSVTITEALRNMTPELEQQLRNAMSDIMSNTDYLEQ